MEEIMQRMSNAFRTVWLMAVFLGVGLAGSPSAQAFILVSDFDDGTLQGWTKEPVFNGTLFVDTAGGNPDGFMVATDTVGAGGPLLARAPGILTADLSIYEGLQWDEFVYNHGSATTGGTFVRLKGFDGTLYDSSWALGPVGSWHTKSVSFTDASDWTLRSGSGAFSDVVSNVNALFLSMDTSILANGSRESGIDNIGLLNRETSNIVPEPSTMALVGMGIIGAIIGRRKRMAW
jgi:hypothetical protein